MAKRKAGRWSTGGLLKDYSALKLGEIAIKGALEKTGTSPKIVDHVVMGYALQTCDQAIFGARHAGLGAGIPQEVPMLTLSRICGSGVQSIVTGAQMVMLGEAKTVVAGGMENMSQAPHVLRGMRDTYKLGRYHAFHARHEVLETCFPYHLQPRSLPLQASPSVPL